MPDPTPCVSVAAEPPVDLPRFGNRTKDERKNLMADVIYKTIVIESTSCAECGCVFGIASDQIQSLRQTGRTFYCPNGHRLSFRESEADRLRKQLAQTTQQLDETATRLTREREAREAQERKTSAARGQVTKLKNRIAGGACPCCNRFFAELAGHMKTEHPNFKHDDAQPEVNP